MISSIPIFQVDAFANNPFEGNPAAVCLMDRELPDAVLQNIAAENNLAETAFVWPEKEHYKIRWFTPAVEVDLCGHATLASAFVLFNHKFHQSPSIRFDSKSGPLYVSRGEDTLLELDFPRDEYIECPCPDLIPEGLNCAVINCVKGKSDYLVQIENESTLKNLSPDFAVIKRLKARGLIVTAAGDSVDFVSRCFFPQSGIDEDPATGSAHTTLIPYWAAILGKEEFKARQLSARGGTLYCKLQQDRVRIGGYAQLYMEGKIYIMN